jgi:gamma-glutamylcyclotransferase (GGCT)/AIG2-like uncharacterized protein YtfP|tara:strand:+ start:275 stop:475 length:201 start_codon:yes stop_codon:yes gene_type:complete
MSARYLQSLRFNVAQCDWLLAHVAGVDSMEEECLDAIDFLEDLKAGYQRERADVSVQMARQEARVV